MKITNFGRHEHQILSAAITKALKDVGDEYGVDLSVTGGRVGSGLGQINLEVKVRETAAGVDGGKALWDRICTHYGLRPEHYGMTFTYQGTLYKVTGLRTSRPKYPIDAIRVHDKRAMKFVASTVAAKLPMKAAA